MPSETKKMSCGDRHGRAGRALIIAPSSDTKLKLKQLRNDLVSIYLPRIALKHPPEYAHSRTFLGNTGVMGAVLTLHNLSDPQQQQLLSEYVDHSRKTADECAHIFRGSLGLYDGDQNDSASSSLGDRKPAYPRHIHLAQFEEVFGTLVADPEPHFGFFHHGKIVAVNPKPEATVCAHRVFCAVALLIRADLHSKIDFVLRLYADIAGILTPEAKSSLIKDFITSVEEVLQLSDSVPGSVLTSIEKALWSDESGKLMSVFELYDVCLTNSQISGMLHSVHALVEEFSASWRQDKLRQCENNVQAQKVSVRSGDNNTQRLKTMSHTMSSATQPRPSLLWDFKAGDYGKFWMKPKLLQFHASETCAHIIEKMARVDAHSALVIESSDAAQSDVNQLLGHVSTDKLLLYVYYFIHLLVQRSKPYEHTRAHAEDIIRHFGASPLRDVVRFYFTDRAPLVGTIHDDEAFFSVLLRFACGEFSVAVAPNYNTVPEAVLGCLTVNDMLAWLNEDITLLKGGERCAAGAFPHLFYAPATIDASASVCECLVEMVSRKLSGILVRTSANSTENKVLSANTFQDLFPASFSALCEKDNKPGPLLNAVMANASVLSPACVVSPNTSIAKVIQQMVDEQVGRATIQRQDGLIVGVVRASDIIVMLLRAQHTSLR